MKVYVLIQEDRHYDTSVTVFADKAESIQTAAARIQHDVNRWRRDDGQPELTIERIAELGTMSEEVVRATTFESHHFGLNASMTATNEPWVFYCRAYDDGPTFRVVETDLVR